MNRSEFQSAMGNCPFIPCECGGSADHRAIHAELTKAVERRVATEWDGTERRSIASQIERAELLARACHEEERIRRAERASVCGIPATTRMERFAAELDRIGTASNLYERLLLASQAYALPILVVVVAGIAAALWLLF